RQAGFGGVNRYKQLVGNNDSDIVINTTHNPNVQLKELAVHSISLDEITKMAKDKEQLLAAITAIQPVKQEHMRHMASGFGYRSDPFTKIRKFHAGMDFSAKTGTPIYATGDGIVQRADNRATGYGNHIV